MEQDVATWHQNIKQSAGKKGIRDLSGSGLIEGLGIQQIKLDQKIFQSYFGTVEIKLRSEVYTWMKVQQTFPRYYKGKMGTI